MIATSSPEKWPVRIGIYGEWGSGKTSVLNFIQMMGEEHGHIVVKFNPWEYSTREQLWQEFINLIYNKLNYSGIKIPRRARQKIKNFGRQVSEAFGHVKLGMAGVPVSLDISGIPYLKSCISFGPGDLAHINELLPDGKRIIVLIDDLDRADPHIVPQLLFAVREMLGLQSFSFILAFDPKVLGEILGRYHPGWGNGINFLEKIIEFPRWLQPPKQDTLFLLANSEIKNNCAFIDNQAFKDILNLCPANPRKFKLFIRQLSLFKGEIERYDPDEINWNILILINLLKAISPGMVHNYFSSKDNCNEIESLKFAKLEIWEPKITDVVNILIKYDNLLEKDRNDIHKIVEQLINNTRITGGQLLFQHTFLIEQPPGITWKEFRNFYKKWENDKTESNVRNWLDAQAKLREINISNLIPELFNIIIDFRLNVLGEAADKKLESERIGLVKNALDALILLRLLSFDLGCFISETPILNENNFESALRMVMQWFHFLNADDYLELREAEKDYLVDICKLTSCDVAKFLNITKPWNISRSIQGFAKEKTDLLYQSLDEILSKRVAEKIINRFERAGGIDELLPENEYISEKYVLFRHKSPFWEGSFRLKFLELSDKAQKDIDIQNNFIELLVMLSSYISYGSGIFSKADIEEIIRDKEIFAAIWGAALSSPIQPRFFGEIMKAKIRCEKIMPYVLDIPEWGKLMEKEFMESSQEQKEES